MEQHIVKMIEVERKKSDFDSSDLGRNTKIENAKPSFYLNACSIQFKQCEIELIG